MRVFGLSLALMLAMCLPAVAGSFREPKTKTCAHSVEHTTSGTRVFLRRGYPNEIGGYARTVRLTVYRDQMGRAVEAKVERDNCFTIGPDAKTSVHHGREMTQAIDAFAREAYIPDRTVEITRDDVTKRLKLSEVLNERRILDPFFHQDHREFSWTHEAHELVVEPIRKTIQLDTCPVDSR